jgi:hypothetical protein
MFELDLERLRANVAAADTDDLLDRVTVYRGDMEAEAVAVIEEELRRRGVTAAQQIDHAARYLNVIRDESGLALRCERCRRPAVWRGWGWHRLWGLLPLFPRRLTLCAEHAGTHPTLLPRAERGEQASEAVQARPGRESGIQDRT